jgi:hypothetical protein
VLVVAVVVGAGPHSFTNSESFVLKGTETS